MMTNPSRVAGAIALAMIAGCSQTPNAPGKPGGKHGAQAVAVEVAPVETGTIRDVGTFTGSIVARSRFVVAPKVSGRLKRLTVDIGDRVRCDQLIAELDDDEYAQALEQARAELAVARANVAQAASSLHTARRELERVEKLRGKSIASESELDIAKAGHDSAAALQAVALAEVSRREAALKAAEVRLSYTRIRASWEGDPEGPTSERVVGERFVHEGAMLGANSPIVSVLDLSTVKAVVHVVERDYSRLSPGHNAVVKVDAFPGREFRGRIERVAPVLKEASRQARVEVTVANAEDLLKPGMFARVTVVFGVHEGVTIIPTDALARRGDEQGVFLLDGAREKVSFVPVKVGMVEGPRAEVLEPELEGEIVTLGLHLLENGSSIILPDEPEAPPTQPEAEARGTGAGK